MGNDDQKSGNVMGKDERNGKEVLQNEQNAGRHYFKILEWDQVQRFKILFSTRKGLQDVGNSTLRCSVHKILLFATSKFIFAENMLTKERLFLLLF